MAGLRSLAVGRPRACVLWGPTDTAFPESVTPGPGSCSARSLGVARGSTWVSWGPQCGLLPLVVVT